MNEMRKERLLPVDEPRLYSKLIARYIKTDN